MSVLPPDGQSILPCLHIYSFLNISMIMLQPQVKCSIASYNWSINAILLIIWPLLILPHFHMPQLCEVSTSARGLYFVLVWLKTILPHTLAHKTNLKCTWGMPSCFTIHLLFIDIFSKYFRKKKKRFKLSTSYNTLLLLIMYLTYSWPVFLRSKWDLAASICSYCLVLQVLPYSINIQWLNKQILICCLPTLKKVTGILRHG